VKRYEVVYLCLGAEWMMLVSVWSSSKGLEYTVLVCRTASHGADSRGSSYYVLRRWVAAKLCSGK